MTRDPIHDQQGRVPEIGADMPSAPAGDGLEPLTTVEAIRRHAVARPDAPAFVTDGQTLTFRRLHEEIEGMAAALLRRGVRPSQPVGLVVASTPLHLLVLLALFRLGAPVATFAPGEPARERPRLLARAGARLCLGLAADAAAGVPHLAIDRLGGPGDVADLPPQPGLDATAFFARSSGTTLGVPKLVATTFAQISAADALVRSRLKLGPHDRYLLLTPIAGLYGRYYARYALVSGAAVIFSARARTAAEVGEAALRHWATVTALTPPIVRDLLRAQRPGVLFPGMRVAVGTAPLSPAERRAAMQRLAPQLYIGYGTSEVVALAMATPEDLEADIATVGRPYEGIEAQSVDDALRPVPTGAIGMLRYRAAHFATAYVVEAPGSSSRFDRGWFYPGDAGSIDAVGRIRLAGRVDDFIDVGGRKFHPGDVESVLMRHPAVEEAAVIGWPSTREGAVAVAVVVARVPVDEAALLAHCAAERSARARPIRAVQVDALPRNAAGKVDRQALIELLRTRLPAHLTPDGG
ncbi:MAG: class I adenylate-forming enzyme family protein [Alphaproteobacteria bacterium]